MFETGGWIGGYMNTDDFIFPNDVYFGGSDYTKGTASNNIWIEENIQIPIPAKIKGKLKALILNMSFADLVLDVNENIYVEKIIN